MTSSYDVMWSSWELVYGDFRLKGVIWACIHSIFRSYLNRFWVMDPLSRTPLTSYFGRHLENRWVKIIFGAGNEFSDPNYMEKVTSHEKIDWLVVLGSNFDLFWRPFWKYRFSGLMRKNPAWYTAEIDSTHKITPRTGLKSLTHPSCHNSHSCTCLIYFKGHPTVAHLSFIWDTLYCGKNGWNLI